MNNGNENWETDTASLKESATDASDELSKYRHMMGGAVPKNLTEYLIENGFFTAPASTKYHGNYEGGLFDHSLEVTNTLVQLTKSNNLKWKHPRSPYIIGMFHDLCKIDNYIKDGDDWTYNTAADTRHGEKSVDLLSRFITLTTEEELCIRWHMGAFDDKDNWKHYTAAVRYYQNVLWTHQADMIASQVHGI